MDNFFYERFLRKSDAELYNIIRNSSDFQKQAVDAASVILQERKEAGISIVKNQTKASDSFLDKFADSLDFSGKMYFRSFSRREIFTSASLAASVLALYFLTKYYSGEEWLENNRFLNFWTYLLVSYILNHVFYRLEHRRRNNFTGRYLQGVLFLFMVAIFFVAIGLLNNGTFSIEVNNLIVAIIAIVFCIFLLEVALSFLNRFFRLLKWHIW